MGRLVQILIIGAIALGLLKIAMINTTLGSVLAVLAVFGFFIWLNQG
jgi:hypothetical protein